MPWKRKKRPPIFEGDVAIKELRARLALAPDQMPEPPLYRASDPIFAVVARLMGVMVLATAGALGFLWITAPHAAPPEGQIAGQPGGELALSYGVPDASQSSPMTESVRAERAPEAPASRASWSVADYARDLTTDGVGTPPAAPAPRAAVPAPTAATPAPLPRLEPVGARRRSAGALPAAASAGARRRSAGALITSAARFCAGASNFGTRSRGANCGVRSAAICCFGVGSR